MVSPSPILEYRMKNTRNLLAITGDRYENYFRDGKTEISQLNININGKRKCN